MNLFLILQRNQKMLLSFFLVLSATYSYAQDEQKEKEPIKIVSAKKINSTTVEVLYANNEKLLFDFYNENIFRLFQDNTGGVLRDPAAKPDAKILVDNPRKSLSSLSFKDDKSQISITTNLVDVEIDKIFL